jgi:hypothetical protein
VGGNLIRGSAPLALLLEQLEVAGRALERGEPARPPAATGETAAPVEGGERGGGAHEPAEEK